jgi:hypothetical protein
LTAGSRLTLNILAYFRVQQQLRHQCFFLLFAEKILEYYFLHHFSRIMRRSGQNNLAYLPTPKTYSRPIQGFFWIFALPIFNS